MSDDRPTWPTPEHSQQVVRELVALLEPYVAGVDGNKDVVSRVKRLLEEKAQARTEALEDAAVFVGWLANGDITPLMRETLQAAARGIRALKAKP